MLAMKEQRQQLSRELREYWDNEVLPSLRASYKWMRDAPIETVVFAGGRRCMAKNVA